MQIIPLSATPSQTLQVNLGGHTVNLNVYQKSTGMYCDVYVDGSLMLAGVVCQNLNRIVRDGYLGFPGDLAFYDTMGVSDPVYDGLGARYVLQYLTPTDAASGVYQ